MQPHCTPEPPARKSAEERFWSKVNKNGPVPSHRPELGQCWIWTATCCRGGYGQFYFAGRQRKSHRVSYEWAYGPIHGSMDCCHSCDTPNCVRPDHLWLGTALDNMRDMKAKGRESHQFGKVHSPATIAKLRAIHLGRKRPATTCEKIRAKALGRKASPAAIAALIAINKGKALSEEHKRAIAKARQGYKQPEEAKEKLRAFRLGKSLSLETKAKIAAANRGKIVSDETRRKLSENNGRRRR